MVALSLLGSFLLPNFLIIQIGCTHRTIKPNNYNKTKQTKKGLLLANWNYYPFSSLNEAKDLWKKDKMCS